MAESVRVHDLEALGAVRAKSATPEFYFQDTDQVDPAGQMRFRMDGDVLRLQRSTSAAWASVVDVMTFHRATGAVTLGGGLTMEGTGDQIAVFRTTTSTAFAGVRLRNQAAGRHWDLVIDENRSLLARHYNGTASTTYLTVTNDGAATFGGALTAAGSVTVGGNIVGSGSNLRIYGGPGNGAYFSMYPSGGANDSQLYYNAASHVWRTQSSGHLMTLNSAGNLGIGTTDVEAWDSAYRAIQLGRDAALMSHTSAASTFWMLNAYYDGAWKYKSASTASTVGMTSNGFEVRVAPSGATDAAIAWTTALAVTPSGNLGLGTTDIEAWHGSYRVIQFHGGNAIGAFATGGFLRLFQNTYIPAGGGNYYVNSSDGAAQVSLKSGSFSVEVAPSGTADTAISWTTALTIQTNGDVRSRALYPTTDNAFILGSANYRWTTVYATNGAIQTSARHLKNLHRPILPVEAMDALRALPIYEFTYKNDDGILRRFGPVLDEVPQWLRPNDDGETWVVGNLVAMNTLAIQATDDEVTRLRQRVEYLEARLN